MDPAQALKLLDTIRSNYRCVADQWDLELMPPERLDEIVAMQLDAKPFLQAAWYGRQGFFISAWSLWEYYSRVLCERLPAKGAGTQGSCVNKVGISLGANNIEFRQKDWFSGANAVRNIIAHYCGRVEEDKAIKCLAEARKNAFPNLGLYADKYILIQDDHISGLDWEIEDFIRQTSGVAKGL